jgi:hypothetical protein
MAIKITVGSLALQKTRMNKGALAQYGISENAVRATHPTLNDEGHARVSELMLDVLSPVISKIARGDTQIEASLMRNIQDFRLTAGSGFSAVLEEKLLQEFPPSQYANLWVTPETKVVSGGKVPQEAEVEF